MLMSICEYSLCKYLLYAKHGHAKHFFFLMKSIESNILLIAFITGLTESVISIYKCSNPIFSVCGSKKHIEKQCSFEREIKQVSTCVIVMQLWWYTR